MEENARLRQQLEMSTANERMALEENARLRQQLEMSTDNERMALAR
jgi:hypothetical protein